MVNWARARLNKLCPVHQLQRRSEDRHDQRDSLLRNVEETDIYTVLTCRVLHSILRNQPHHLDRLKPSPRMEFVSPAVLGDRAWFPARVYQEVRAQGFIIIGFFQHAFCCDRGGFDHSFAALFSPKPEHPGRFACLVPRMALTSSLQLWKPLSTNLCSLIPTASPLLRDQHTPVKERDGSWTRRMQTKAGQKNVHIGLPDAQV